MKVLKCGELAECGINPTDFMIAVSQQAEKAVIANEVPVITHWWLLESSPVTKLAYFGTQESYDAWKRRGVQ